MKKSTFLQWKKAKEGILRNIFEIPFQHNYVSSNKSIQTYLNSDGIIFRMISDNDTIIFEIDEEIINLTSFIYIPTNEDLEMWEDLGLDIVEEINKLENGI